MFLQEDEMLEYITGELDSNEKELFIVVETDVERTQKWLKAVTTTQ